MRLRYIHLPDYGPLKNVAFVLQQNPFIENRAGAVNFVVGLNGSGKSSLLRAIYDVFHSLAREELPDFPVTLAYEIYKSSYWTVIFHRPRGAPSKCFLVPAADRLDFATAEGWQNYVEHNLAPPGNADSLGYYVAGDRLKGDGNLRNWLPSRVLAYTSGDYALWQNLAYPSFPADELKDDPNEFRREDERPIGWRADQEHYDVRVPTVGDPAYDPPFGGLGEESAEDERCLLLQPEDAKLAAIAVGIWQAALDLEPRTESWQREAFRGERIAEIDAKKTAEDPARRLLNELDWLWPTHAAFHFASYAKHLRHPDSAACYWLLALADVVLAHPLDEALAVVSLGNRPPLDPAALVGELAGDAEKALMLRIAAKDMTSSCCGAEALRSLFAGEHSEEESLWFIFRALRNWRASGLLKDVNLTVKRVHPVVAADGQEDDSILSYTCFSDGEQMLLGRMALLLLLRKQDNSLLLLDEPETHFNDVWKRQIIDMVDDSILKDTSAQVLVSTHTSLALTDVFASEITRLVKERGITQALPVAHPTFGADPGRLLLHVFGAPDVIGARAAEFLRSKLDPAKWPPEDREKLRSLIDEIGSGWPRAKLMEILDKLENQDAARNP